MKRPTVLEDYADGGVRWMIVAFAGMFLIPFAVFACLAIKALIGG